MKARKEGGLAVRGSRRHDMNGAISSSRKESIQLSISSFTSALASCHIAELG
jgi:hypothetical protein